jgi:hypothetical protein
MMPSRKDDGMMSLTVTADDPHFWAVLEFLRTRRAGPGEPSKAPEVVPHEETEDMIAQGESNHLIQRLGVGSTQFLSAIVEYCVKADTRTFTIADIAGQMGVSEKHARANQRNVMKSARALGIELWQKRWDVHNRRQVFSISQRRLDALRQFV